MGSSTFLLEAYATLFTVMKARASIYVPMLIPRATTSGLRGEPDEK
jgi:hypothetical protein